MSNPSNRYVTEYGLQQPSASDLTDGVTGTGVVVEANTPTLITPILGAATATTLVTSSIITVHNTIIDGPNQVAINTSTYTTIGSAQTANEGLAIIRDNDNGGTCLIIYDAVTGTPVIIAQVGTGTTYTTAGSPGATQVDLQFNSGLIQAKGGASRNGTNITVKQLFG
jgi:hypothetical protein